MSSVAYEKFYRIALRNKLKVALYEEEKEITYGDLLSDIEKIAKSLYLIGIKPGDIIALIFVPSISTIAVILAIFKLGATYLPIDPNSPVLRIKFILGDAMPKLIISNIKHSSFKEASAAYRCLQYEDLFCSRVKQESNCQKDINSFAFDHNHAAYIIYTSGSTGFPKGVLVSYKSLLSLFTATEKVFALQKGYNFILFHSYAFDVSVWEIFGAMFYGGSLVIPCRETVQNNNNLFSIMKKYKVNFLNFTISALLNFSAAINVQNILLELKPQWIVLAGEKVFPNQLVAWVSCLNAGNTKMVNMYGITEATVHASFYQFSSDDIKKEESLIGLPLADRRFYVMNENLDLVPTGSVGQLCIAGSGIANGYLNNALLTNKKFLPNPFGEGKMLLTGDMVKQLPDKTYQYLGRIDSQVQLKGYRIELEEIESMLMTHALISRAKVALMLPDTPNAYIKAYYSAQSPISSVGLGDFLKQRLPHYMLPVEYCFLDYFPVNLNGKVDVKLLEMYLD